MPWSFISFLTALAAASVTASSNSAPIFAERSTSLSLFLIGREDDLLLRGFLRPFFVAGRYLLVARFFVIITSGSSEKQPLLVYQVEPSRAASRVAKMAA